MKALPSSLTFSLRLLTRTVWCGARVATDGPASGEAITVSISISASVKQGQERDSLLSFVLISSELDWRSEGDRGS